MHTQLASVVLPTGDHEFEAHDVHADASPYILYVPAWHFEHVPPHLKKFAVGWIVKLSSELVCPLLVFELHLAPFPES